MEKKIYISGMSCMHCVNRVKNALEALDGVMQAGVDLDNHFALVLAEKNIPDDKFKEAVEDAGYEVIKIESV